MKSSGTYKGLPVFECIKHPYRCSKDYKRLVELLNEGFSIACYLLVGEWSNTTNLEGGGYSLKEYWRRAGTARLEQVSVARVGEIIYTVGGHTGYLHSFGEAEFIKDCESADLEYIAPHDYADSKIKKVSLNLQLFFSKNKILS
jgi:hypothetical protein